MPLSSTFVIRSSVGLLGAGLLVLLIIVGATIWLGERAQSSYSNVADARIVRSVAVELRNAVQTAESSQRGFIATSNEIYLAPLWSREGANHPPTPSSRAHPRAAGHARADHPPCGSGRKQDR
jgi:hypothetical protein